MKPHYLSIIIPIYNAEKYLHKCIDSILSQTFSNYEIILIDDGSTDSSSAICKKYASIDSRIHYYSKKNEGAFQSRLYGIERAQGLYIMFCDADDYYINKHVFQKIYNLCEKYNFSVMQFGYLKKYNHLKKKVAITKQIEFISEEEFMRNEYPLLLCSSWESSRLLPLLWNKVYHSSLLNYAPSSQNSHRVFWGEDLILNLYLLEKCSSVIYIPDILYVYQAEVGGTKSFSKQTMSDLNIIKKYQLIFYQNWNYNEQAKEKIKRNIFCETAGWFFVFIKEALQNLEEQEVRELIKDTLSTENFKLTRAYLLENKNEQWPAAKLIRNSNPDEYIKYIKEESPTTSIKNQIISIAKKIYRHI